MTVQFLDESQEIRSHYASDADYDPFAGPLMAQECSPDPSPSMSGVNDQQTPSSVLSPTEGLTVLSLLNSDSPTGSQPSLPAPPLTSYNVPVSPPSQPPTGSGSFVYQRPPGAPVLWPLENEQEAMLLQHYIENVALFVRRF